MKKFTSEFFQNNRRKLRQAFGGTAPIVITSNGLIQRTWQDDTFGFYQDSNFWYLTGIDEPNFILVIEGDKDYLIGPELSERWKAFHGGIDFSRLQEVSGADEVLEGAKGWQKLSKKIKRAKHVATMIPPKPFDENYQVYTSPAKRRLIKLLKSHNQDLKLIDVSRHIAGLRVVKQEPEIEAIQAAINETCAIYKVLGKKLAKFKNEREVSAEIDYIFARKGFKYAFKQIVAGGKNATTLHYNKNNSPIDPAKPLLIDMGVNLNGYCSDLTRVVSQSGGTKRQLAVYNAVLQVQEFALKMLRPNVQLESYESAVEHYMGEKLRELGLIKTIDTASVRKYYPHHTSHFLGIDVHDVGDYTKPLQPGNVLTVEPGIYIPEEDIGIRIEDNILITEGGNRVLSERLSRELASLTILSK